MSNISRLWLVVLIELLSFQNVNAQVANETKILSFSDFYELILKNHPVLKLANLEVEFAQSDLLISRGAFDPKIVSTFNKKSINGKDYYNEWATDLKIPIWGGIDAKIGTERNFGERLNPELTSGVSSFAGFSVPLGRGLLLEERRNTLEQSKIFQKIASAEQRKIINKVVFSATKTYWEWYLAYQILTFNEESINLAKKRFEFVKSQVVMGEKAGIDSIEAKITLQSRIIEFQKSYVDFQNATLLLSTFLWGTTNQPVVLSENVLPMAVSSILIDENKLQEILQTAKTTHPEIQKLDFKSEQLIFQEKFQKELLKPKLDFNFNILNTPKYNLTELGVIKTNNKIGLDFELPLYLRKERGKLQQVRVKQIQLDNESVLLKRQIEVEVYSAYNQLVNISGLIRMQNEVIENQSFLLSAEQEKFKIGESSLFLLNSRETKLIEQKIKLEELKAKYEKSFAELIYSAGLSSLL